MKRRFESEIQQEYPEWYAEWETEQFKNPYPVPTTKPTSKPKPAKQKRVPGYILPMFLSIIALTVYVVLIGIKLKIEQGQNASAMMAVQQSISRYDNLLKHVNQNAEALNLLAILHNENFAALRNVTGTQDLIFIQPDWKISQPPQHLDLSEEQDHLIRDQYLDED